MAQSVAAKSEHQLSSTSDSGPYNTTQRYSKDENTPASEVIMVKTKIDHAKVGSSPTKYRRNQLLTDQTNVVRGHAEGQPQFPDTAKGFPVCNDEKDTAKGNLSNLGSENRSRHKREKSQI